MAEISEADFLTLLKTKCVGLTGGVATGKSTVAQILRDLGKTVIDADQLARDVVKPGTSTLQDVVNAFGNDILHHDGHLDRSKLRMIVMNDTVQRKRLEAIIHPAIHKRFKKIVEDLKMQHSGKTFFYEAALIYEAGRENIFKEIWATTCPQDVQVARLCHRSKISKQDAHKIIAAQMPVSEKAPKAALLIDTNCPLEDLRMQVEELVKVRAP